MTKRERIEALELEVAQLRDRMVLLEAATTVHHHHYSPPSTAVEKPWRVMPYFCSVGGEPPRLHGGLRNT